MNMPAINLLTAVRAQRVDLYDGDAPAPFATDVDLWEAFPEAADYDEALAVLCRAGEYHVGGGAAPHYRIVVARPFRALQPRGAS